LEGKDLEKTQDSLDALPPNASKEQVAKSGILPKISRFLNKAQNAESTLGKALNMGKKGVEHLKTLALAYVKISGWLL